MDLAKKNFIKLMSLPIILTAGLSQVLADPGRINNPVNLTFGTIIDSILNRLLPGLVVLVFLGMIAYGGFKRITSQGDPEEIEQSTRIITSAIIGFIIIALAPIAINLLALLIGIEPPFALFS